MAQEQYTPVSFGKEVLKADKLNQLASNTQWLFENSPRMRYTSGDLKKADGLKIAAGRTWYTARSGGTFTNLAISFGDYFSVGCTPVIVTTANPVESWHWVYTAIGGIDNGDGLPDHRGFWCSVMIGTGRMPNDRMMGTGGWVNWIAIGY